MNKLTETLIVIPARGGSKRLKGKNKVLLKGLPLFMHSAKAAKKINGKIRVIISTEDCMYCTEIGIVIRRSLLWFG